MCLRALRGLRLFFLSLYLKGLRSFAGSLPLNPLPNPRNALCSLKPRSELEAAAWAKDREDFLVKAMKVGAPLKVQMGTLAVQGFKA